MNDLLRSLFMKAARKPAAAAGVLLAAMAGSMVLGMAMGSCSGLGLGRRETAPIAAREGEAGSAAAESVYRLTGLSGEPEMRVRVALAVPRAAFDGASEFRVGWMNEARGVEAVRGPLQVSLTATDWVVRDGTGRERTWAAEKDLHVAPVSAKAGSEGWASMNGVKYAGTFRLGLPPKPAAPTRVGAPAGGVLGAAQPAGESAGAAAGPEAAPAPIGFDVIEHVKIEEYLPGVVAKELIQSWSLEAFKVQAITARSYAIHERQRSIAVGRKFDVESTTQDQVYGGATALPVAVRAVAETRGMVLEHNGSVLRAYYSSTCGGRTASARDTWPTTRGFEFNLAAPIQGQERAFACESSPLFRWKVERPKAELVRRLVAYGERNGFMIRQLKDIAKIEVHRVNETGRPAEYKVVEPGGRWYPLKAEELRLACNTDYPGAPAITRQTRVNSGDLEFVVQGSTVTISGRGFGHGVGMCQYCAQAMAGKVVEPVALLEKFYPGARVVRAY